MKPLPSPRRHLLTLFGLCLAFTALAAFCGWLMESSVVACLLSAFWNYLLWVPGFEHYFWLKRNYETFNKISIPE